MPVDREAAARAIEAFLVAIGRDPAADPELIGTGARVASAFLDEICRGYHVDTHALLEGASLVAAAPALVVVRDVPITTMCPHHLLPATGTGTIALSARERLVGLGALAGLFDAHARRLTLQETIGERVVDDVMSVLQPEWAACRLVMTHACLSGRGEHAIGARVETLSVRGSVSAATYDAVGVGR